MQKRGELPRLAVNLLIGSLILILAVIIWIILRGGTNNQEIYDDENIDLKISQVKKIDDNTLDVTLKRNVGEGEFIGLSFQVSDGATTEIIRVNSSMLEGQTGNFSLKFISLNASRVKKISVTPIYLNEEGVEVIGNVEDEYVTPNTCSNYCPTGAQCGFNGCGMQCGSGCDSGYLCLNYQCIKQQSSSGGGGGGSSGGSSDSSDDTNDENSDSSDDEIDDEQENVEGDYSNVYLDKGLRYGDALDYQCGTRNIDGTVFSYGECPLEGYDCIDNLCIARNDLSCDGVACEEGEYCSHGVCLLEVSGDTFFVALWGNDSWNGTFEQPFYTWQRVVGELGPGDIAYFRGGVWRPTTAEEGRMAIDGPRSYNTAVSGTAENPIRYFNYPGEKPILDKELILPDQYTGWGGGIGMGDVEYIHLKGLTVRHVHQSPPNYTRTWKPYSEVGGIGCAPCANIIYENLVVHDIDGRGFQHWSGAWSDLDAQYAVDVGNQDERQEPYFQSDNTTWINCDAYNLFDRYDDSPGNAADGWKVETYYAGTFHWINCRAFNYSDDGFDPHGSGKRIFDGCWAIATDKYSGLTDLWGMEQNGFKMTGVIPDVVPNYEVGGESLVIVRNSLAADCAGSGIVNNIVVGYEENNQWPNNGILYNNLAYKDGMGYHDKNGSTYFNNVVYDSQDIEATGTKYEVYLYYAWINGSNNTWIYYPFSGDWWWKYNPAYNVTDADFISLDTLQLMSQRKSDYSLPDVTFGHLAQGSDLIDAGTIILGYHCATAGPHPGQNCREWYGSAPDLGAFESNY